MNPIVPFLSTVLFTIAASFVLIILLLKIYSKIRQKFPSKVNCWFCNEWVIVSYDSKNSFDCPSCHQYNGFTKSGDYDKIIPEQHDELLNNKANKSKNTNDTVNDVNRNGLCALCNNNQRLKIFQLANFVPMVEDNYDAEVEHFQAQLEKAYKLCKKCDRVLRQTLDSQNRWIFGNRLKNLYQKGLSSIQKMKISESLKTESIFSMLNRYASLLIVSSIFLMTVHQNKTIINSGVAKWVTKFVKSQDVSFLYNMYNKYKTLYFDNGFVSRNMQEVLMNITTPIENMHLIQAVQSKIWLKSLKIDKVVLSCAGGFFLQTISALRDGGYDRTVKMNRFLCWIILLLTNWFKLSRYHYFGYIWCIQIFSCCYLTYSLLKKTNDDGDSRSPLSRKNRDNKMTRKMIRNLEYTCSDLSGNYSDDTDQDNEVTEEFCNSSRSSRKSRSKSQPQKVPINPATKNFDQQQFHQHNTDLGNFQQCSPAKSNHSNLSGNTSFYTIVSGEGNFQEAPSKNLMTSSHNNNVNRNFDNFTTMLDPDLHRSMTNLHLGNLSSNCQNVNNNNGKSVYDNSRGFVQNFVDNNASVYGTKSFNEGSLYGASRACSPQLQRPKPVLSPPRLSCSSFSNSWVAGGFWRNQDGILMTANGPVTNLSRSSSQSSGFGSQQNENQCCHSNNNSKSNLLRNQQQNIFLMQSRPVHYDQPSFDRRSVMSEPAFYGFRPDTAKTTVPQGNSQCNQHNRNGVYPNLDSNGVYFHEVNFPPLQGESPLNKNDSQLFYHHQQQQPNASSLFKNYRTEPERLTTTPTTANFCNNLSFQNQQQNSAFVRN